MTRILAALLLICVTLANPARAADLTVFAAASLTNAMKDVAAAWQKQGGVPIHLSLDSSSTLARQLEQGAPANLFASADLKWMDWAQQRHLIADDTRRTLLGNTLVLVMPHDHLTHVTISKSLNLAALLGPTGRLAVGDPAHVPAGLYAKDALIHLDLWASVENRLASAANVRAALLLVERGEAPAGIVYSTDAAVAPGVAIAGTFPADSHQPIAYPFAVTRAGDTKDARALMTFLSGPAATAIFVKYGFKAEGK
jgi:molybdate transport system substrate-binding protein